MTKDRGLFLCAPICDRLTPLGKAIDYEEGGATVKLASLSARYDEGTNFYTENMRQLY